MRRKLFLTITLVLTCATGLAINAKKPLTVEDIMRFRSIEAAVISEDGRWLAYEARPDRGDSTGYVRSLVGSSEFVVERGSSPVITKDSSWVGFMVKPLLADVEKASRKKGKKKDKPRNALALVRTSDGKTISLEDVKSFKFSDDSRWVAYQTEPPKKEKGDEKGDEEPAEEDKEQGSPLVLRNLASGEEFRAENVGEHAFDKPSTVLIYAVNGTKDEDGRVSGWKLSGTTVEAIQLSSGKDTSYSSLSWSREQSNLAFVGVRKLNGVAHGSLYHWKPAFSSAEEIVSSTNVQEGWTVPLKNEVTWTRDSRRIFFGVRPESPSDESEESEEKPESEEVAPDPLDVNDLLTETGVDVWHWNDPFINTHQKKLWKRQQERTFAAVYHLDSGQAVQLADDDVPDVQRSENPDVALATSDLPYRKLVTWLGRSNDIHLVDLATGQRLLVARNVRSRPTLSPGGGFVAYFTDPHWFLYDRSTGTTRNLTADLDVSFANEDHDYPSARRSYRSPGWIEDDQAILIQDKYDVWRFPTSGGLPTCLTGGEGRAAMTEMRVETLDPEALAFGRDEELVLRGFNHRTKAFSLLTADAAQHEVTSRLEGSYRFRIQAKARQADAVLFSRESYREFPDLWVSNSQFDSPRKVTDVNPQVSEFAWGNAELVEWNSLDGRPLQGVLIKPGNYEEGKRYPVVVYFYRFFSQRLNEFNQMKVNHRPNFPFYASNGYAVFLPDIRFDIGQPGFSATKCLVPGVQKLVDMGVADPKAVGLHGHSWSGYQTAFVITQTNIFAAAVAGAPVSNMTSAYSGIRWRTGLARQFQYEQTQSRIGGSLWEYPERYIENSPVFFADRIETPLLIQFGDEDGAVPWYQGIELYLAMRRLEKDCIFLQYRGEPHHLQKYPNKVDYTLKMKEYFDHYLKGTPAPDWIAKGVPYEGK